MNGKGSQRRPAVVSDARLAEEWERIFGQREPEPGEQGTRGARAGARVPYVSK